MPLRIRRGTDAERLTITPAEGELIYTTDLKRVYVGDGTTLGGVQITANASIDNLESDLNLNNFDIIGTGNININGDVSGNLVGDVTGSLFANDSTVLVDGMSGNHYGLFNGNVIGNVTGNVIGSLTGNVLGDVTGNVNGNVNGDVTGSVFADDSTILVDGLSGNHYGTFNGNLNGNLNGNVTGNVTGNLLGDVTGNVTGNVNGNLTGTLTGNVFGDLLGTVTGNLIGDIEGSVFAADSTVLVDALSGNHYGIFNGTLNGSFNGDTNGPHFGPVEGNVTGNLNGNVRGQLIGSVFGDDSTILVDGVGSTLNGNFIGRIDSREKHRIVNEDETITTFNFFNKTAPGSARGTVLRLNGYKGSFENPQEPDNFSRLSIAFRFWDDTLVNYDNKAIISGFTQSNGSGFMYIGTKKFDGTFTDGIRLDGSDGSISLRNFGRIDLEAPITNIGDLAIENNQIINPTTNQNIKLVCNGVGTIELSVPTQTTVGSAGPANALPASPDIYIRINVNGVNYVVPAFAVS